MTKAGFYPDTISTDLHARSMNDSVRDALYVMSKMLALGMPLDKVFAANTWNAAKAIKRDAQIGHLSVGAVADVAVLRVDKGRFGFTDVHGARLTGDQRLRCQLTLREGKVVWDEDAVTRTDWTTLPPGYRGVGDPKWDGYAEAPRAPRAGGTRQP
jgi:dihydroorotase